MTKSEYIYSKDNLLEKPQKYQFTKFEGKEFLNIYTNSRKKHLLKLNVKNPCQDELESILLNKNTEYSSTTEKKLTKICLELINNQNIAKIDNNVNFYLKKFEISKKILSDYSVKKEFEEYDKLENYVMLSLILVIKFKKIYDLRFINTILKLNDTICSSWKKEMDVNFSRLFSFCLESEMEFIKEIMINAEVEV
tara:strand:+ start:118 stop:702 length:585 start_codon:yes stop_codon:yes gene_type:complete